MNRFHWIKYLDYLLRLLIGLLFLVAALTKIVDVEAIAQMMSGSQNSAPNRGIFQIDKFIQSVSDYGVVHESLLAPTVVSLLVAEIFAGLGLLFYIRGSLTLITGLLFLFVGVLSYGLWLGLEMDCGCFGIDTRPWTGKGLWWALGRNIVLLLCCLFLFLRQQHLAFDQQRNLNKGEQG